MTREQLICRIDEVTNGISSWSEEAELEAQCWAFLEGTLKDDRMDEVRSEINDGQYTIYDAVYSACDEER